MRKQRRVPTEEQVREIRETFADKSNTLTVSDFAQLYDISPSTIRRIIDGEWKPRKEFKEQAKPSGSPLKCDGQLTFSEADVYKAVKTTLQVEYPFADPDVIISKANSIMIAFRKYRRGRD